MVSLIGVIYWYIWSRWLPHRKGKEYTLEREWIVGDDGVGRQVFRKVRSISTTVSNASLD